MSNQNITHDRLLEVLNYNPLTGIFTWRSGRQGVTSTELIAGGEYTCKDGYSYIGIDYKTYRAHRLAWFYVHGSWPSDQIDHRNRVTSDNRISNLREATTKTNHQNMPMRSDNTSGVTGVNWSKQNKKWETRIYHAGKLFYRKYHQSFHKAIAIRKALEFMLDYDQSHGKSAINT